MTHLIYLKVAKVGTQNSDMTTSIERTVVTLESGKNFNNFVKHLHVQNFLTSEAEKPTVLKAVEFKHGEPGKEIDSLQYSKQVLEALNKAKNPNQEVDYKALSEKQSAKISEMEQMMQSFNERLKEAEGSKLVSNTGTTLQEYVADRPKLELKATELNIQFRSTIGDDKLLEKIQAIEPEYNLN